MATENDRSYEKVLGNGDSLAIFLRRMAKFDQLFCEAMMSGEDYTLKLEVRGDKGKLLHARVISDGFERPRGVEKEIAKRHR